MADLAHLYGQDLALGPTGDLAVAAGTQAGQERVLRRLLTSPGDYLWHLEYGAGLPRFVGQPARADRLAAVTRSQMFRERAVARVPAPQVSVSARPDGTVVERVTYTDAASGQQSVLTVPVG